MLNLASLTHPDQTGGLELQAMNLRVPKSFQRALRDQAKLDRKSMSLLFVQAALAGNPQLKKLFQQYENEPTGEPTRSLPSSS